MKRKKIWYLPLWFLMMGFMIRGIQTRLKKFFCRIGLFVLIPEFAWFDCIQTYNIVMNQIIICIILFIISSFYFRKMSRKILLQSCNILALYTILMLILNKCFGYIENRFWYEIWLWSVPVEWNLTSCYFLSGIYDIYSLKIWHLIPSIFLPYVYVLLGRKGEPDNKHSLLRKKFEDFLHLNNTVHRE